MWIARDKDGSLKIFVNKPVRIDDKNYNCYWRNSIGDEYPTFGGFIDNSLYPNLTWNDEPIEVELWSKDCWKRTIDDIVHKYISKNDSGEYDCTNDIINSLFDELL